MMVNYVTACQYTKKIRSTVYHKTIIQHLQKETKGKEGEREREREREKECKAITFYSTQHATLRESRSFLAEADKSYM